MILLNVSAIDHSRTTVLVGLHTSLYRGWRRRVAAMPLLLDYFFIYNVSYGLPLPIHNVRLLATLTVHCSVGITEI